MIPEQRMANRERVIPSKKQIEEIKLILKPSETMGNYEIWERQNNNCDRTESY